MSIKSKLRISPAPSPESGNSKKQPPFHHIPLPFFRLNDVRSQPPSFESPIAYLQPRALIFPSRVARRNAPLESPKTRQRIGKGRSSHPSTDRWPELWEWCSLSGSWRENRRIVGIRARSNNGRSGLSPLSLYGKDSPLTDLFSVHPFLRPSFSRFSALSLALSSSRPLIVSFSRSVALTVSLSASTFTISFDLAAPLLSRRIVITREPVFHYC